jgi:hypothetical protein
VVEATVERVVEVPVTVERVVEVPVERVVEPIERVVRDLPILAEAVRSPAAALALMLIGASTRAGSHRRRAFRVSHGHGCLAPLS